MRADYIVAFTNLVHGDLSDIGRLNLFQINSFVSYTIDCVLWKWGKELAFILKKIILNSC